MWHFIELTIINAGKSRTAGMCLKANQSDKFSDTSSKRRDQDPLGRSFSLFFLLHNCAKHLLLLSLLFLHTSNWNNSVNLVFDLPNGALDPPNLPHHHVHCLVH